MDIRDFGYERAGNTGTIVAAEDRRVLREERGRSEMVLDVCIFRKRAPANHSICECTLLRGS